MPILVIISLLSENTYMFHKCHSTYSVSELIHFACKISSLGTLGKTFNPASRHVIERDLPSAVESSQTHNVGQAVDLTLCKTSSWCLSGVFDACVTNLDSSMAPFVNVKHDCIARMHRIWQNDPILRLRWVFFESLMLGLALNISPFV